jgi:hypothetical protein
MVIRSLFLQEGNSRIDGSKKQEGQMMMLESRNNGAQDAPQDN